ncbi:MAG: glycosyltransferase family 2 protein [Bacteroidetes bacterium]|nr:glycosyltransferase family 2 protein [Bacteroidota bacterium]
MMISVVIPCRNEEKNIAECIEAIFGADIGGDTLEVLVVDGMSDDKTLEILGSLSKKYPTLRVVPNQLKITPVAFNLGIKESTGDFIQIIGARQIISENYLRDAKKSLTENPDIWCVGGTVTNVYQTPQSEIIGLAMGSSFGVGGGNFRVLKKSEFTDTVGTPMYPRKVFDEIGYFNESLLRNQDDEFNYRVTKKGKKILLNAEITIKYYVRAKVSNLFRQYYQYGYWKVFVNKMHGAITNLRQLVPLFFVMGLIAGLALSFVHPVLMWIYVGALVLYCLLALSAGISVAKKVGKGIRVAAIFPVLHFSYGWGYLVGLIHFVCLGKKPAESAASLSR